MLKGNTLRSVGNSSTAC